MLWIVLIILAIAAAYFLYNNNQTGRATRDQTNYLGSQQASNAAEKSHGQNDAAQTDTHDTSAAPTDLAEQPKAAPHDGPSLLYADRNSVSETELASDAKTSSDERMARAENLPIDEAISAADTMDFTAETATLSSEEVGTPANSSDYEQPNRNDKPFAATQTDPSISQGTNAANAQTHAQHTAAEHSHRPADDSHGISGGQAAVAISAVAAGMAGATTARATSKSTSSDTHLSTMAHPTSEGIDLELGDNTHNDGQELEDANDELLDFGDLTADISEMLKELNLRESDSPRLEINEEEYQQLKTGDPGEVKPAKIENVAGKLRNMLQ